MRKPLSGGSARGSMSHELSGQGQRHLPRAPGIPRPTTGVAVFAQQMIIRHRGLEEQRAGISGQVALTPSCAPRPLPNLFHLVDGEGNFDDLGHCLRRSTLRKQFRTGDDAPVGAPSSAKPSSSPPSQRLAGTSRPVRLAGESVIHAPSCLGRQRAVSDVVVEALVTFAKGGGFAHAAPLRRGRIHFSGC